MTSACLALPAIAIWFAVLEKSQASRDAIATGLKVEAPELQNYELKAGQILEAVTGMLASQGSGIVHMTSNAPGVDPMIANIDAPFYPSRISTGGKPVTREMFLKAEACKECHGEIYKQWSQSIMSHAWEDPIYRAILKRANIATAGAVDNFCIGCHSPIGLTTDTAYAQSTDNTATGVDCESCHTVSSITGVGNGSIVLTPFISKRPIKYGPRNDALSPFHDTTYSELHRTSEYCATCHNVTHPFNRLAVERTYDEWRDSWYHGVGIGCQDCHMSVGPGNVEKPGQSALNGKVRSHVFAHTFIGANVTLHKHFGENEKADLVKRLLEGAAKLQWIDAPDAARAGEPLGMRVKVENVNAGHKLPTGFPEGREVWIDFQVRDEAGKEIYRLGAIKEGQTEKGTKSFKAILGDKHGNVVDLNVWEADRILSDTRILPKGFAEVEYAFAVPADATGKLTIIADLNYMSFPQYVLDDLFGKDVMKSEIIRMGSLRKEVQITKS